MLKLFNKFAIKKCKKSETGNTDMELWHDLFLLIAFFYSKCAIATEIQKYPHLCMRDGDR